MIFGPKVIVYGRPGTFKTRSTRTILEVDPSVELFYIMTEPNGVAMINDLPTDRVHYQLIKPTSSNWDVLLRAAKLVNVLDFKALSEMPSGDKSKHQEWLRFIQACFNFTDDRTGKEYGPLDKLPMNSVIRFDSLSGLGTMALNLMSGSKPTHGKHEWGVPMTLIESWILNITTGMPQSVVLIAHAESNDDPLTGGTFITVSTLGQKLAPKVPINFTDVIYSKQVADKFLWSTMAMGAVNKNNNIPLKDSMEPNFVPLFKNWLKNGDHSLPR